MSTLDGCNTVSHTDDNSHSQKYRKNKKKSVTSVGFILFKNKHPLLMFCISHKRNFQSSVILFLFFPMEFEL